MLLVILLATVSSLLLTVTGFTQEPPELPEIDYDFYYPARAKGKYPTVWDPGKIDNVNLFNGNLYLAIPLDMVLEPGGDLSWQPVLHYNSKIWNDATRDDFADTTNHNQYHMYTYEHSGYLETNRYAGLGWSLTGPYLHLKRVKGRNYHRAQPLVHSTTNPPYPVSDWDVDPMLQSHREERLSCGSTPCVVHLVDSVVMPDGSRHSLRPCRESWDCSHADSADDDNTWFSADGSGWKVTWTDADDDGDFSPGDTFVGESGGLRYIFDLPFLIDTDYSVFYQSRNTDFIAGTRGWYCSKIESVRWSGVYPLGPRIELSYHVPSAEDVGWSEEIVSDPQNNIFTDPNFNRWRDPPILEKVTSYTSSGAVDATINVSRVALGGTIFNPVRCGQADPPSSCSITDSETIQVISAIDMKSSSGTMLAEYTFTYEDSNGYSLFSAPVMWEIDGVVHDATVRWVSDFRNPNNVPYSNREHPFGYEYLKTSTRGFPLLSAVTRSDTTGNTDGLVWTFEYSFANKMTDSLIGAPTSCELCPSDFRTGLLSSVTQPNGATIHYDIGHWHIMPHDLSCESTQRPGQLSAYNLPLAKTDTDEFPSFCKPVRRAVSAGVNQRWVEDNDKLLEWTEYIHSGPHSRYGPQADSWSDNAAYLQYESVFNQFLLQDHAPFDFEHTDRSSAPLLPDNPYFTGISQTIVRKHLVVDNDPPPDAAKGLIPLPDGTTTELPSYRFDDTIHVFMTGAFVYDKNGDDSITIHEDHVGKLSVAGRPLQVRSYRGSAMCENDTFSDGTTCAAADGTASPGEEFWWWLSPDPDNLLSVGTFEYTLEWEQESPPDALTYDDVMKIWVRNPDKNAYPNDELCNTGPPRVDSINEFLHYCDNRSQNVRVRRQITKHRTPGAISTYSGSESWYETDSLIPTTNLVSSPPTISAPKFASNQVLTLGLADFVTVDPLSTTPAWTIGSVTDFKKDHMTGNYGQWSPPLPSRQETAVGGSPISRNEISYAYDNDLILRRRTQKGGSSPDTSTYYDYYDDASEAGSYGRVKTVTVGNSQTVGEETLHSFDITAYAYDHQQLTKKWKLCARADLCDDWQEVCTGWAVDTSDPAPAPAWTTPVGSCFGASTDLPAELIGQQTIDPDWRWPTSRADANGDGLSEIGYDWLGRVTSLVPTSSDLASTFLVYPDLRTSLVRIQSDATDISGTVVARHSFDGLGRISHTAQRQQGTASTGYDVDDFRHKVYRYDGTGTAWAESHWHEWLSSDDLDDPGNPLPAPSSLSTRDEHFELVSRIDPFARIEQAISSDGGQVQTTYLGDRYADQLLIDLADSSRRMSRTVSRSDALGNLVTSWEAKNNNGLTALLTGAAIETTLDDTDSFVRSEYSYDVGNRLLGVTVVGKDADDTEVSQVRTFEYDGLGNLIREEYPELGGNWVRYSDFDPRGTPRMVEHMLVNGTAENTLFNASDAAGRPTATWFLDGDAWLAYSSSEWGSTAAYHDVGKLVRTTQYNLMLAGVTACGGDLTWQADGSTAVSHAYSYNGPLGMLSNRVTEVAFGCGGNDGSVQLELGYGHDFWGNTSSIVYPNLGTDQDLGCGLPEPPTITYQWDIAGGLDAINHGPVDGGIGLLNGVTHDPATGMMSAWKTLTGTQDDAWWIEHELTIDGTRARPSSIRARPQGGTADIFDTGSFAYDVLGNITGLGGGTATPAWSYEYDPLACLTEATGGVDIREFDYDDLGNLVSIGGTTLSVDPDSNRLNGTGYHYDNRGNLKTQPFGSWSRQLRFDLANRVMAAWATPAPLDDGLFGFAYDTEGERVLKYRMQQPGDETTREIVSADFYLRDETGNVLTEYQWLPVALGEETGGLNRLADHVYLGRNEVVTLQPVQDPYSGEWISWDYTTLVHDHLGSTRAEVYDDTSWTRIDYWPFGEFKDRWAAGNPAETLQNNRRYYTGHEREYVGTEFGFSPLENLDYMHARYYVHRLGRFLSVDEMNGTAGSSQSWVRYSYSTNNPIKFIDPDGRYKVDIHLWLQAYLAVFQGRGLEESFRMGLANQGVDDFHSAVEFWRTRDFSLHFGTHQEGAALVQSARGRGPDALGAALHSVMDPFVHSGYAWPFGHVFHLGAPDNPALSQASQVNAMAMTRTVFGHMGGNPAALDFQFLRQLFAERSLRRRIEMLQERTTQSLTGAQADQNIELAVHPKHVDELATYFQSLGYSVRVDGVPY